MKKIFISYSSADEKYKEQMISHLSGLKHRGVIETWHDRDIVAGDIKGDEVDQNINQAAVILLMVSPDFIGSMYCYGYEMQYAIRLHEEGRARVIPVMLRPCDIEGAPFENLKSVPERSWVSQYDDKDSVFLEVVEQIKTAIKETVHKKELATKKEYVHKSSFFEWLNDTEVVLKSRATEVIRLDDIYIYPDLRGLD